MSTKPPAFLSYARVDSAFALRLAADLKAAGANVWLDQLDIRPGRQWDREVEQALAACGEMLVILSPASVDSTNVMDEVAFALEEGKTVIPVIQGDCRIPFRLRRLQHVDFRSDYVRGVKALLDTLAVEDQVISAATSVQGESVSTLQKSIETSDKREESLPYQIDREKAQAAHKAEQARIEREKAEAAHKVEQARIEREKAEAAHKAEQARIEREKAEAAHKAEQARIEREKAEAAHKVEQARIEWEKAEAAHKFELDRIEQEKATTTSKAEQDRRTARWTSVPQCIVSDREKEVVSLPLTKKAIAEFIGTFWLVFGGCGSAVFAAAFPHLGIGLFGVALAFGLTVLTMAFAIGHVSGCHLNPAVTMGLIVGKRFPASNLLAYVVAQVAGGIVGAACLYVIAIGKPGFSLAGGFASNGYAAHSPGGYSLLACLVSEVVLTFMFLVIILGATDRRSPQRFAPVAIGLGLTLIHLLGIPVTNLSVNPARSTGPALFVGGWAVQQLWLFWLAPIVGAAIAGVVYPIIAGKPELEHKDAGLINT